MTLSDGWPPFYSERSSAAIVNPSQLYLGYAAIAVLIGLFLILPGVRGMERLYFLLRWSTSLFIGAAIIACAQGVSWHAGEVEAVMPYKVNSEEMVRFKVGLKIGLVQFNVTLRGDSLGNSGDISFSEKYYFLQADEALEDSLKRGLPFPILNVVEHFSVNRISTIWMWGRRYWIAGHYSFYMLWSAFGTWIVANVLFHTVLLYGGMVLAFTGLLLLSANVSFFTIGNHGRELRIHLGYYDSNAVLVPTFGWCYWLCFVTGCLCLVCGITVMVVHKVNQKSLRLFFNYERDDNMLEDVVDTSSYEKAATCSKDQDLKFAGENNVAFNAAPSDELESGQHFKDDNANSKYTISDTKSYRKISKVSFTFDEVPNSNDLTNKAVSLPAVASGDEAQLSVHIVGKQTNDIVGTGNEYNNTAL